MKRKVLIIGGAGYVGSQLTPKLLKLGYEVNVLDTFWYGDEFLKSLHDSKLRLIKGDMRDTNIVDAAMKDCSDVIHLACISNDPSFDLNPNLGKSINLDSFLPIVKSAQTNGVGRFIYASSSSVYGVKEEEKVTEELELEPLTDYSKFKAECEKILLDQDNGLMTSVIVRPATVCGVSPRQRLDLAVNILTINALVNNKITVFGGKQFRPNLHIDDMCRSYIHLLQTPAEAVSRKIYNVGAKNHSLDEIAKSVREIVGKNIEIEHKETNDLRSYRVDSTRIKEEIGFLPKFDINHAISDLVKAYKDGDYQNPLNNPVYTNINQMKELRLG